MARSIQQPLPVMEVRRVDDAVAKGEGPVRNLDRLSGIPLHAAKAQAGACIREGIGPRALKEFGDASLVGKVCTGEKVPDYLARIFQDPKAARRFGMAVLDTVPGATVTVSVTLPTADALAKEQQ